MSDKPGMGSRDAIAAHAQKILDAKIAEGAIVDNPASAAEVARPGMAFSPGTIAIDPDTGRPAIPKAATDVSAITEGKTIAPNATGALGTDTEAGAATEAAAAGRADAPRGADGKFISERTTEAAPAPPGQAPAATVEQRTEAAAGAAAQILDDWADFGEVTFEHDDGSKYTVRAKKDQIKQIERFNRRQAQVDKHASWMNRYRPTLEPLIVEGRLDPIMPIMQQALQDQEFGDAIVTIYNRRMTKQPIFPTVAAPAAPAGASTPGAAPAAAALQIPEISDPYVAEVMAPVFSSLQAQFAAQQQRLDAWEGQQRTQTEQQQRAAQQQAWRTQQVGLAHQDLVQQYPGEFTGDVARDKSALDPIFRYAREGGYLEQYGPRAGILIAKQHYDRSRAEAGSPAAAMLDAIDRTTLQAAGVQAGAARSVGGGTPVVQPRRSAPPKPPDIHDAQGRRKDTRTYMAEVQAYNAQIAAGA